MDGKRSRRVSPVQGGKGKRPPQKREQRRVQAACGRSGEGGVPIASGG